MRSVVDLNAAWRFAWSGFKGDVDTPPELSEPLRDAVVPGDAHLDLMREGVLPDLYTGMNADHALWMERKDWWYTKEFDTPPDVGTRRAHLVFHGLDTFATVWLNGRLLGRTDNMFRRYVFDVADILRESGSNRLVVRLAAPAFSARIDPNHRPMEWSPERLFCRKAQMSFGWDIAPRLVTIGIWRPVELALVDDAQITDLWVVPERFNGSDVTVQVQVEVDWLGKPPGLGHVKGVVHGVEWEVKTEFHQGRNMISKRILLKDAPCWWPVGYAEPNLCDASVSIEAAGRRLDSRRCRFGLRALELIQEPQPSGATSFRFRCNGRDIFVTGLNWTPLDAIFARVSREKITRTLEALARIGCNMLRVWGGGIYESEHFYNECDRLGIMVWQDFMMACGWYPQTDGFAAALEAEARQVVRDLRGHPCLAIWAGDNECDVMNPEMAGGNRLTRDVLPQVCRELHPHIPYVPSSPYSPSGADPGSAKEGDAHCYAHGRNYRAGAMWNARCRFMSEFGRLALPSMRVIGRHFPAGTEWPLTGPMWMYHGSDTIYTGRFRVADKILSELRECGKPDPRNIEEAVEASQDLQAEAIVALIEKYCSDPEFGGFLLWNVADCWPQQSDSVLDYEGNPKPVFRLLGPLFGKIREQHSAVHGESLVD